MGAVLTTNRFGVANSAYSFDGVSAQIQVPQSSQFDPGSYTISLWVQANTWISKGSGAYVDLISKDNPAAEGGWCVQATQTGQIRPCVTTTNVTSIFNTVATLNTGHWHQVVAVWDGAVNWCFIDGALAGSSPAAGALVLENAPVRIGADAQAGAYFCGNLSDIRFYDVALSSNQVQELYSYEAVTSCPPHVATATAAVTDGYVVSATVTEGGCGYTNTPSVLIVGGGGSNATATAVVSDGMVVGIAITDLGSGYTNTPAILIASPLGLQLSLIKSVKPSFNNLSLTTNYQLQVSGDLKTWTNQGAAFTATNFSMVYPQYFDVPDWNQLFFRLEPSP